MSNFDVRQRPVNGVPRDQKSSALSFFCTVPETVKPHLKAVFERAMQGLYYPDDTFAHIDVQDAVTGIPYLFDTLPAKVSIPRGPGDVVVINPRNIRGVRKHRPPDQPLQRILDKLFNFIGFPRRNESPQLAGHMMRKSMVDGFDLMFPADALRAYMLNELSMLSMQRVYTCQKMYTDSISSITYDLKDFLSQVAKFDQEHLGFIIRHDPDDQRPFLERTEGELGNLHIRNTLAVIDFLKTNPEYVLALFYWTHGLREYCRDLENFARDHLKDHEKEIIREAPFWETMKLISGGNKINGRSFFYHNTPVITSILAAILEQAGIDHQNASHREIEGKDVRPALEQLSISGIFLKKGEEINTGKVVRMLCPVSRKLTEWLTMDLGDDGNPEDMVFIRYLAKVREELEMNDSLTCFLISIVQEKLDDISNGYGAKKAREALEPIQK